MLRDSKEAEAGRDHSVYLQGGREKGTKISLFYTFICCLNFVLVIFMHSRIICYLFFIPRHTRWPLCPTFRLFSHGNGAAVISRERRANKVSVPVLRMTKKSVSLKVHLVISTLLCSSLAKGMAAPHSKGSLSSRT